MTDRFGTRSGRRGDRLVKEHFIACSICAKTDSMSANNYAGVIPDEGIAANFRNKGWVIGRALDRHKCPSCNAEEIAARRSKGKHGEAPELVEKVQAAVAAENREMSIKDRRAIFIELNEAYGDGCYRDGWSDADLAQMMNVPVEWVAVIREQNFGPEKNPETELRAALEEAIKRAEDDHKAIATLMAELGGMVREVATLRAQMEATSNALAEANRRAASLATANRELHAKVTALLPPLKVAS